MNSFKTNCALFATIILWASAFIGIKIGLEGYSPGALALLRFIAASLSLALVYPHKSIYKHISLFDKGMLILAGVAGIGIYHTCLNYGELSVSAGIASFVIGLMPVITIILSVIFLREKQKSGVWFGVLISLAGLALLAMWEGAQENMALGILLILVSATTGSILTLVQRFYAKKYHPVAIITWVIWGGTLSLIPFLPSLIHEIPMAPAKATWAGIYMGVFPGALAYLAFGWVLKTLSASKASVSLYALPIVSTLLGFIFLKEEPSVISLLGGTIALAGAVVAQYYQQAKPTKTREHSVLAT